jgi:hypothetical protein
LIIVENVVSALLSDVAPDMPMAVTNSLNVRAHPQDVTQLGPLAAGLAALRRRVISKEPAAGPTKS